MRQRVELDRLARRGDCLGQATLGRQQLTVPLLAPGVARIERYRSLEVRLRARPVPLQGVTDKPARGVAAGIVGSEFHRLIRRLFGTPVPGGIPRLIRNEKLRCGETFIGRDIVRIEGNRAVVSVDGELIAVEISPIEGLLA